MALLYGRTGDGFVKTCQYCRKKIDVQAVKCPYCASDFDGAQMEAGRRESSRTYRNSILGALVVLGALVWWMTRPETIQQQAEIAAQRQIDAENRAAR